MAKAILQRLHRDERLVLEAARLRTRVRDLEGVIADLQRDNERLREAWNAELEIVREPVH